MIPGVWVLLTSQMFNNDSSSSCLFNVGFSAVFLVSVIPNVLSYALTFIDQLKFSIVHRKWLFFIVIRNVLWNFDKSLNSFFMYRCVLFLGKIKKVCKIILAVFCKHFFQTMQRFNLLRSPQGLFARIKGELLTR